MTQNVVSLIEDAPSARAIQTARQAAKLLAPYRQSKQVRAALQEITQVA